MSVAVKQSGSNISPSLNMMHSIKRSAFCNCMPVIRLTHCYKLKHQLRCYTVCQLQCSYIDSYRIAGYGQGGNGSARTQQRSEPLSIQPQTSLNTHLFKNFRERLQILSKKGMLLIYYFSAIAIIIQWQKCTYFCRKST